MVSSCGSNHAAPSVDSETLSFLTLNAGHGRKSTWNQMFVNTERTYENLDHIAVLLDETAADVVALQEADAPSRWSGKIDHVLYLRDNTNYNCSLLGEHAQTWLYSFGTALLTHTMMRDAISVTFPASPPTTTKGFVMATVHWDYGEGPVPVTVVSVHLDFSRKSVRDAQVAILIDALRDLSTPIVLMGDLNSQWDQKRSHVRHLSDELGLMAFEPESTTLGTYRGSEGKRLDWILASEDIEFIDYRVLSERVSDHLAVYAKIGISGSVQ